MMRVPAPPCLYPEFGGDVTKQLNFFKGFPHDRQHLTEPTADPLEPDRADCGPVVEKKIMTETTLRRPGSGSGDVLQ